MSEKLKQPEKYEHDVSIEEARADIKSNFPDLDISTIEPAGAGFTNVAFLVNSEYIFRFAKRIRASSQISMETKILPQLESNLDLPIPHIEYSGVRTVNGFKFMGYKKIDGQELQKEKYEALDKPHQDEVISKIASFINTMHSFPIEQAQKAGVEIKDYKAHYLKEFEVVKEKVFPLINEQTQKQLGAIFEEYLSDEKNFDYLPSLMHGEIGPKHILTDEEGSITGIIDFGDMHIGDPDFEYYYPYKGYGQEFISKLLENSQNTSHERAIKKMKFFALYHSIIQIIFIGIRENEGALKKGLEALENFMKNNSTF
jgi:aminoglycoside 2''-phosphotransferase